MIMVIEFEASCDLAGCSEAQSICGCLTKDEAMKRSIEIFGWTFEHDIHLCPACTSE